MGCPILLGFAEKVSEIARQSWAELTTLEQDEVVEMVRIAMRTKPPYREQLSRRAHEALNIIIFDMLKRSLGSSQMATDTDWLTEIPASLDPAPTAEVLRRIQDRAIAWDTSQSFEEGMAKTYGEFAMIFTKRVFVIANIADSLLHDMAQDSFTTAGTALAHAMAVSKVTSSEWGPVFQKLKDIE